MAPAKEWTLMFYFASDNALAPTIVSQLKAIKDAGFHPDVNVIAQFDPHTVNTPTHIFDVNLVYKLKNPGVSKVGFGANDPYVRNLVLDKLWGEEEQSVRTRIKKYLENGAGNKPSDVNDGNDEDGQGPIIEYNPPMPSALISKEEDPAEGLKLFLDFCQENYKARHYILFILGHGLVVGNDFFLYDEHATKHSLLLTELGDKLKEFKENIAEDEEPGELELVSFHSCSMSAVEVAYQLKGAARYMLSSQGPAFVGSWPYRHILLRVFNDLNSCCITERDLKEPGKLIERFQGGTDAVSSYLASKLKDETRRLLEQHDRESGPPAPALVRALISRLNDLLDDPKLYQAKRFEQVKLADETKALLSPNLRGFDAKWLNRMLLMDACPELENKQRPTVEEMVVKIFYYCLYNSYDYQLAGYSFDVSLCDLSKVDDQLTNALDGLATTLIEALKDPVAQEQVLLAHWDAQSFWQESYTDLYDFCFRLQRRCNSLYQIEDVMPQPPVEIRKASEKLVGPLKDVWEACEKVISVLHRGSDTAKGRLIMRSEFAGPAYQYSHGLSIFFPWSEPVGSKMWDEEYEKYELNKRTSWRKFLKAYFDATRRFTHLGESDPREGQAKRTINNDLLGLLQEIGARVFQDEAQLSNDGTKHGSNDPMSKHGPNDPTGGDCDCPSIKNYPLFTNPRTGVSYNEGEKEESKPAPTVTTKLPFSPNFFDEFNMS